ncbi:MAG: SDR family NAD(P)-dependent oxidoreductase [Burkholderiaceae bacterium]
MKRFESKVAVVTGAAHGIGAAVARRLAEEGASVAVADIDLAAAQITANEIIAAGGAAIACAADVSDREAVAAIVDAALSAWGQVNIMVANAGIVDRAPFLDMSDALFDRVLKTNLHGTFYCGQLAARQMVKQGQGGRIVNISSNSGIFGGRGRAAYGASKAGIINLTQTMAIELAEHGILVNAVAPGATRTRAVGNVTEPAPLVKARTPLARLAEPSEIAAVVAFLASDDCTFTTGHVVGADGGFTVAGVMEG